MSHDKIDDAMAINYESDLAHWKKRAIDAESALAAQQEQTEPVAKYGGRRKSPDGTNECWALLLCKPEFDPPEGTKLYTAPQSGVRDGMLRDYWLDERDVKTAYEYMRECNFPDMAACRVVEAAYRHITRAADQVNAEGCTRSHPHDDMNAECERKTTIARETNSRANAMQAIKEDAPVMKAWNNYKSSDEFKNTRKWALHEEHVDGSLWAAFYAGFFACAVDQVNAEGRIESLQLPPLNEIMYHAVRGLELDFGSGESLFQGSIDDDTLDLIWESINTALRCAKVSPSAPHSASQPDTVAVPREASAEMCEAYYDLCREQETLAVAASEIWRVMLRAAQEGK